jgi:hypothetical protein
MKKPRPGIANQTGAKVTPHQQKGKHNIADKHGFQLGQ